MDKVIIDGIDISECPNFKAGICSKRLCELCVNEKCSYKQLKRLEQENERLKEEIKQYKKYKFLFEKAKEFKEKTDKWASKCLAENEDLKDTIKRTVCQAECFRYKQANKYRQALQEIREICKNSHTSASEDFYRTADKIQAKINEVIGAE